MIDDPLSLLMQGILALAAGMYPLGFLFGTCSACCNQCRSDTCEGFDLEEAFSCRRGGTTYCPEFTQGPDLLSLVFSETCFGSGATGEVQGPGADVGAGPLIGASVSEGGSGYARLGRQAPTLSVGNSNTTPADVTISFSQTQGECGLDFWAVDSITVNNGGEGYTDGAFLDLTASEDTTVVLAAVGSILTLKVQPTITASTANGTGATFTVSVEALGVSPNPLTWTISGVTFSGTTSGFVDGEPVTFSGDNLVEVNIDGVPLDPTESNARATVVTKRAEPQLSPIISFSNGSGAVLAVTLASNNDNPETWSVDDIQITSAGTGYSMFDLIEFSVVSGTQEMAAFANVSAVGANGEILAISIGGAGSFYDTSDELDFIQLDEGGVFYRDDGTISSIELLGGGSYYGEDPELTPYVAVPTVTIQQFPPSAGTGGQITAVVDDDTSSPTFGEVISLTLANAGDGYLAWDFVNDFEYLGDGRFAFGERLLAGGSERPRSVGGPSKGCRVSGDGISSGTRVTDITAEVLEEWVLAPKKGCCRFSYEREPGSWNPNPTDPAKVWVPSGPPETVTFPADQQPVTVFTEAFCQGLAEITPFFVAPELITFPVEQPIAIGDVYNEGFVYYKLISRTFDSWDECLDCAGGATLPRERESNRIYSGRLIVTVDPVPDDVPGCVTFCGQSGLCGPLPGGSGLNDEAQRFGEDQTSDVDLRKMCVRWLCRCYVGTGQKSELNPETNEPLYPDPEDWYTVESTTEVGGPVVFGGSITEKLEAALAPSGSDYSSFEHETLFGRDVWPAGDGDRFCLVYAFVFFGTSSEAVYDACQVEDGKNRDPKVVEPKDVYQIFPCDRCSCN